MPSPGGSSDYPYNDKVLLAAVISLSAVVSFVILLHLYARCLLRRRSHVVAGREPSHRSSLMTIINPGEMMRADGLDAKVVASLPRFVYKQEANQAVDCVICLSVMEEGEEGRVLPECKHAFHVGCIDMWLMFHSTCPICRAPVIREELMSVVVAADQGGDQVEDDDQGVRLGGLGGAVEGAFEEVSVEMPVTSSSSSPSSLGCSLKRMMSRSRSGSRIFPSVPII